MLNKEDVDNLNKLLDIVKRSKSKNALDISYSKGYGWSLTVWDQETLGSNSTGGYKKQRLGTLCLDLIVEIIQERLNGDG